MMRIRFLFFCITSLYCIAVVAQQDISEPNNNQSLILEHNCLDATHIGFDSKDDRLEKIQQTFETSSKKKPIAAGGLATVLSSFIFPEFSTSLFIGSLSYAAAHVAYFPKVKDLENSLNEKVLNTEGDCYTSEELLLSLITKTPINKQQIDPISFKRVYDYLESIGYENLESLSRDYSDLLALLDNPVNSDDKINPENANQSVNCFEYSKNIRRKENVKSKSMARGDILADCFYYLEY